MTTASPPEGSDDRPWRQTLLRVRYAETDAMGIAHHAEYLAWFEVGRTEWIRQGPREADGVERSYRRLERAGYFLPVIDLHARYMRSARYDDEIVVRSRLAEFSRARLVFEYEIRSVVDDALLCEGRTVHAVATPEGRARRLPHGVLDWLLGAPDAAGPET